MMGVNAVSSRLNALISYDVLTLVDRYRKRKHRNHSAWTSKETTFTNYLKNKDTSYWYDNLGGMFARHSRGLQTTLY